jgi:CheY-like chemotaxis protein
MKSILLVDDDKTFNFIHTKLLESFKTIEVNTALNGQRALDFLMGCFQGIRRIPDIIFLDLNMPIMDGFGFLEAFRKLPFPEKEKVKIVIVTSSYNPADIERAGALGVFHYMTKPLKLEDLEAHI